MNLVIKLIGLVAVAISLTACGTTSRAERAERKAMCVSERTSDGSMYFKALDIKMAGCPVFTWEAIPGRCSRADNKEWDEALHALAEGNKKPGTKWRVPTRAEMDKLVHCLKNVDSNTYTLAEVSPDGKKVLSLRNGQYRWSDWSHETWMISGGDPAAQASFDRLVAERVSPNVVAKLKKREERTAQSTKSFWDYQKQFQRDSVAERRAAVAKLGQYPKGSTLHCTSEEVVPVNWRVDQANFNCPAGLLTAKDLTDAKWKIVESSRMHAQAADYNAHSYGMRNWNGRGVHIMITAEKK